MVFLLIYFEAFEATRMPGWAAGSIICIAYAASTVNVGFTGVTLYRSSAVREAKDNAIQALSTLDISDERDPAESTAAGDNEQEEGEEKQRKRKKSKSTWKRVLVQLVPLLIVVFIALVYILGVFAVYRAVESNEAKLGVYLFALALKAVGNKAQILVMERIPGFPLWSADLNVYFYELLTALLCRVLLMSIPDIDTAVLFSILNAVFELMIRNWFYVRYMSKGAHEIQQREQREQQAMPIRMITTTMSTMAAAHETEADASKSKAHVRYWQEGSLRLIDGGNDMVVEYVSSVVACAIVYWLSPIKTFRFATDAQVDGWTLLRLALVQMVPEVFVDAYACSLEITGGLLEHYRSYYGGSVQWSIVLGKVALTVILVAVVLIASIKS
jgi:ABC-type transport system involved in cytochrome bd biosynthesis fused ATPase/permease subunit